LNLTVGRWAKDKNQGDGERTLVKERFFIGLKQGKKCEGSKKRDMEEKNCTKLPMEAKTLFRRDSRKGRGSPKVESREEGMGR